MTDPATMLYLAKQMDDHTGGNSVIVMDWGNVAIDCGTWHLKNILSDMARDYVRLRKKEDDEKAAAANKAAA